MALKVKAQEKLVKFSKNDPGTYRYVMAPDLYIALTQEKVIKEAALRSGVSRGVMQACRLLIINPCRYLSIGRGTRRWQGSFRCLNP